MSLKSFTYNKILLIIALSAVIIVVNWMVNPPKSSAYPQINNILALKVDSPEIDLPYPFNDGIGGPGGNNSGGLFLNNPSNVESGFQYDPETGT